MVMSTKLSVLVCVHSNDDLHDQYFEEALRSLDEQTFKDFELVIVFDECRKETINILNKFNFNNLIYFERPQKQGLAIAKNFGFQKCSGELIAFLDADDKSLPSRFEKQVQYLNTNHEVSFCATESYDMDHEGLNIQPNCFQIGHFNTHEQILAILPKQNVLCHGSMMIRAKALNDLGGYSESLDYRGKEDWELWLRAMSRGYKFYKIPERLYIWRCGTSVSR